MIDIIPREDKAAEVVVILNILMLPGVCRQQPDCIRQVYRFVIFPVCQIDLNHIDILSCLFQLTALPPTVYFYERRYIRIILQNT